MDELDRPAFLLGAGFSKAASSAMPLMYELSDLLRDRRASSTESLPLFGSDLEAWLSFLATKQPWLTDSENLRHQADFIDATHAIQAIISEMEQIATSAPMPIWLIRLMQYMSNARANVITFNYDTLLERTARELGTCNGCNDLYSVPLPERALAGRGAFFGSSEITSPRITLHKLHGSINWYSRSLPLSLASAEVYLSSNFLAWSANSQALPPAHYRDLVPLVIPPVASKGTYYESDTLRAQWSNAAAALSSCTSLTIIGYSFPASDSQTRALFLSCLSPDCLVRVIDRSPERAATILELFARKGRLTESYVGERAILSFVEKVAPTFIEWHISNEADASDRAPVVYVDGARYSIKESEFAAASEQIGLSEPSIDTLHRYVEVKWPGLTSTTKGWSKRGEYGRCGFFYPDGVAIRKVFLKSKRAY